MKIGEGEEKAFLKKSFLLPFPKPHPLLFQRLSTLSNPCWRDGAGMSVRAV